MWIRTIKGWQFFKMKYTSQGLPYPTKKVVGNTNLYDTKKD